MPRRGALHDSTDPDTGYLGQTAPPAVRPRRGGSSEGLETRLMKKPKGEYAIQTVINAMRLLEAFREEEELGVTELSRRLALHKNNVFRLLATLEQQGYIEQRADTERYRLGVGALELGQSFARSRSLLRSAAPVIAEPGGGDVRDRAPGRAARPRGGAPERRSATAAGDVGAAGGSGVCPVHCTALGKVLVGLCPGGAAAGVRPRAPLRRRAREPHRDDHRRSRQAARAPAGRGAARLRAGHGGVRGRPGLRLGPGARLDAEVVAALSVSGPQFRLPEDALLAKVVPLVVDGADRLSRDLGYAT